MKQIRKILLAICIIVATVAAVDVAFGIISDRLIVPSMHTKFNYAMQSKENPELVIFGSSRAENHYDTPFINDSLHIRAFNLGEAGRGLTYHDAAIRAYLRNHTPKVILLDLLANDLSGDGNNRIKQLYPYIPDYPEIMEIACKADPLNKYLLKSHLLRSNSEIFRHLKKCRHPYNYTSFGFTPLRKKSTVKDLQEIVINVPDKNIDTVAKECLIDICNACNEREVKLVVVMSPEYSVRNYDIPVEMVCESIGITCINDLRFKFDESNINYFYDNLHLNGQGAREYTRSIITRLINDSIIQQPL